MSAVNQTSPAAEQSGAFNGQGRRPRAHGKLLSRFLRAYFNGPDHPAKLRFWSWFRQAAGYRRLTIPYGDGGYITVDERDWLQRSIFIKGDYEVEVWSALASFAVRDEVLWDIGAHVGAVSVRASLDRRFRTVHAFEADALQAEILRENLALNSGNWNVHSLAVSNEPGVARFQRASGNNSGMSRIVMSGGGGTVPVAATSIDRLVFAEDLPAPTLLKIDVEGWEMRVLEGARRLLRESPPKAIVFESASDGGGALISGEIPEYLRRFGYDVRWIPRPGGEHYENENYCAALRKSGSES